MLKSKMLVVGGTGFIGKHLVSTATSEGYDVTVLSLGHNHAQLNNVEYYSADLTCFKELYDVLSEKEYHYVINLGGYVDHSKYRDGGNKVIKTHLTGVQNLLNCLNWESLESFIQIGSSDEYGSHAPPQHEGLREMPISPYSAAKTGVTQLLQMLNRVEGFPAVILRFFLIYGEGQNEQRFIPQIIAGCLKSETFPVSLGEQLRDFSHIDDIVNAILLAIKCPEAHGEIINIASGKPVKIKDVLEEIREIVGSGDPQYGVLPYRPGESMALYADISKANKILSWQPRITLNDGLNRTIKYFREKNLSW